MPVPPGAMFQPCYPTLHITLLEPAPIDPNTRRAGRSTTPVSYAVVPPAGHANDAAPPHNPEGRPSPARNCSPGDCTATTGTPPLQTDEMPRPRDHYYDSDGQGDLPDPSHRNTAHKEGPTT